MKQVSPLISGVLIAVIFWLLDSIMLSYTLADPTLMGVLFTQAPIVRLSYRLLFLLICVFIGGYRSYRRIMNFDSIFDQEDKQKNVRDSIRNKYLKRVKVETVHVGHETIERLCAEDDARIENVNKRRPPKRESFLLRDVSERNRQTWEYCSVLGVKIGLSVRDLSKLNTLCYCHDMGNWDDEANHIERGVKIAEEIPEYRRLAFAIKFHHERYDGKGPYGLKGKRIPIICRVFAVANKFYELTDPEKENALDRKKALAALMDYSGTLLDPELVLVFISTVDNANARPASDELLTSRFGGGLSLPD